MSKQFELIERLITEKKISVSSMVEVGAYTPQYSLGYMFATRYPDMKVGIVEANAQYAVEMIYALAQAKSVSNSIVYPFAISSHEGYVSLMVPNESGDRRSGAYVKGNKSAFLNRFKGSEADTTEVHVPSCRFNRIDNGKIDLLIIDIEGSEWDVIQDIESSPALIVVEMYHSPPKEFVNANFGKIIEWMKENDYVPVAIDEPDIYFLKSKYTTPEEVIDLP